MLLSIIIPIYNVENYVERCIRSCEQQDIPFDEYEIICVNDGSKDNSLQIIESLAKEFENITILNQENQGLSVARNNGLKIASGEYIWFVDSDDWIADNCLGNITQSLRKEKLEALIIRGVRVLNGNEIITRNGFETSVMTGIEMMHHHSINCAAVLTIIKKSLFIEHKVYFYPGIYHEDQEFTPKMYYYIKRIKQSNYYVYKNRLNQQSITQSVNPKKGFDLLKVAESLYKFCNDYIQEKDRYLFYDFICSDLNQSMSNIIIASEEIKRRYKAELKSKNYLFRLFYKSSKKQYILEGVLFKLGFSPLFIYSVIRKMKA